MNPYMNGFRSCTRPMRWPWFISSVYRTSHPESSAAAMIHESYMPKFVAPNVSSASLCVSAVTETTSQTCFSGSRASAIAAGGILYFLLETLTNSLRTCALMTTCPLVTRASARLALGLSGRTAYKRMFESRKYLSATAVGFVAIKLVVRRYFHRFPDFLKSCPLFLKRFFSLQQHLLFLAKSRLLNKLIPLLEAKLRHQFRRQPDRQAVAPFRNFHRNHHGYIFAPMYIINQ